MRHQFYKNMLSPVIYLSAQYPKRIAEALAVDIEVEHAKRYPKLLFNR